MTKSIWALLILVLLLAACSPPSTPTLSTPTLPTPTLSTPTLPTPTPAPPTPTPTLPTPTPSTHILHQLSGMITGLDSGAQAVLNLELLEAGTYTDLWPKVSPGLQSPYPGRGTQVAQFGVTNGRWQAEDLDLKSGLYNLVPEANDYVTTRMKWVLVVPEESIGFRYSDLNFQFLHPADATARLGSPLCAAAPPHGGDYVVPPAPPSPTPTRPPTLLTGTVFPTPAWPAGTCYAGYFYPFAASPSALMGQVRGLAPGQTAALAIYAVPPSPGEMYTRDIPPPPDGKRQYAYGQGPLAVVPTLAPGTVLTATMTVGNGPWGLIDPHLPGHKYVVTIVSPGDTLWPKSYEVVVYSSKILGLTTGVDFSAGTPHFSMTPVPTPTPFVIPTLRVEQITLEQAQRLATFHLSTPSYLPSGYRLRWVTHAGDGFSLDYGGPGPSSRPGSQGFLRIGERYSPPGVLPPGMTLPPTPDIPRETALVHNRQALVVRSFPPAAWYTPEPGISSFPSLEWGENDVYFVVGGSLSLDELVKIANSLK